MSLETEIQTQRYLEAVNLPKFKASLDRLLNKSGYDFVLTDHHDVSLEDLPEFVKRAVIEGNAVLIQREWNGFFVILWKD